MLSSYVIQGFDRDDTRAVVARIYIVLDMPSYID